VKDLSDKQVWCHTGWCVNVYIPDTADRSLGFGWILGLWRNIPSTCSKLQRIPAFVRSPKYSVPLQQEDTYTFKELNILRIKYGWCVINCFCNFILDADDGTVPWQQTMSSLNVFISSPLPSENSEPNSTTRQFTWDINGAIDNTQPLDVPLSLPGSTAFTPQQVVASSVKDVCESGPLCLKYSSVGIAVM